MVTVPPGDRQQIGFITVSASEERSYTFIADNQVAVFLPFSYQMGGTTVIMSRKNVVEIDMSVEDALRFTATAGVVGTVNDEKTEGKGFGKILICGRLCVMQAGAIGYG